MLVHWESGETPSQIVCKKKCLDSLEFSCDFLCLSPEHCFFLCPFSRNVSFLCIWLYSFLKMFTLNICTCSKYSFSTKSLPPALLKQDATSHTVGKNMLLIILSTHPALPFYFLTYKSEGSTCSSWQGQEHITIFLFRKGNWARVNTSQWNSSIFFPTMQCLARGLAS